MKSSYYNIFFPYEGKIIGYNGISDKFIILEQLLYDLFQAGENEDLLGNLDRYHEDLYETLISNGFIVPKETDEIEIIKYISDEVDFNEEHFQLTINPTMNCNFKCWYCYEKHIKASKMTEDTVQKICNFIDNIITEKGDKLKSFDLQWFGGEPLLYFKKTILPLLEYAYPKMKQHNIHFYSGFTTNGLLINQEMLDDCKRNGVKFFQITLDGDKERHDKVRFTSKNKGSYEEIVRNIKLSIKNGFKVNVRINISEETVLNLLKIINDFEEISNEMKELLEFSFHQVWQEEKNLSTDISEIVEQFRNKGFTCLYKGETIGAIRQSCYADKLNQAVINYNGEVFKCTARDFSSENREGLLSEQGKIIWNEKFQERMYQYRFKNKPCLACKLLPVCNGGCSQHKIENKEQDYCIFNYDEEAKVDVIKEKFYSRLNLM